MKNNRVIFVTGATRNTGLAIARGFAAGGWDVTVSSRDGAAARETAAALKREYAGVETLGVAMDPARVEGIRAAFAEIRATFGRLDAFVSNAANLGVGLSVLNTTPEDWDAVMNTNARGTFFGAQEAAKLMPEGGAMVFISSVHAVKSIPGRICYTASKAAIGGMVRCLALELGHKGIRVNSILAGAIRSDRWDKLSDEEVAARRARYPSGRESFPEEVAAAVRFLCSDEARTVTGMEMPVDSGIGICLLPYNKDWAKADPNNEKYWERK